MSLRQQIKARIRNSLRARGLELGRSSQSSLPAVSEYLAELFANPDAIRRARCFDGELRIQTELLKCLAPNQIRFYSKGGLSNLPEREGEPARDTAGEAPELVTVDLHEFDLEDLFLAHPELRSASAILLRGSPDLFGRGAISVAMLESIMSARGFHWVEVLGGEIPGTYDGGSSRVVLAFESSARKGELEARTTRIETARALLERPLARAGNMRRLAGRGSCGFQAGVFNPGAIRRDGDVNLICRGELAPWAVHKADRDKFMGSCVPVHIRLDESLSPSSWNQLRVVGLPAEETCRVEDFRMFEHRGQVYSNHTLTRFRDSSPTALKALDLGALVSCVLVSEVDLEKGTLAPMGSPHLGRPMGRVEKNWSMFVVEGELYLIYSMSPYRLYRASAWPDLCFNRIAELGVEAEKSPDPFPFRNSINPVPYDADHLLHIVHRVFPGKRYVFWAVLIEEASLRPVRITKRPLASGWATAPAEILYVSSALTNKSAVHLFGGLNDSATATWTIDRKELDPQWTDWDAGECQQASSPPFHPVAD